MRPRLVGKIVLGVLTICFVGGGLYFAHVTGKDNMYQGVRALACLLTALTCATFYRYFED